MQKSLLILLIIIVGFTSCEGRISHKQSLNESVVQFNKENTINSISHIPETYFERQVDTMLANGFNVKITTKTNTTNSIVLSEKKNNILKTTHFKTFDFRIQVSKDNFTIYNKSFNRKKVFEGLDHLIKSEVEYLSTDFKKTAILKAIQLNEELSSLKDSVYIDIAYSKPNDSYLDWYTLKIDKNGTSKFIQFVN